MNSGSMWVATPSPWWTLTTYFLPVSRRTRTKEWPRGSEGAMFAEQVELPRIVVTFGCDGLVVTAYLSEMGCLELEGDLHHGVRNISGGFIGDGIFGRWG